MGGNGGGWTVRKGGNQRKPITASTTPLPPITAHYRPLPPITGTAYYRPLPPITAYVPASSNTITPSGSPPPVASSATIDRTSPLLSTSEPLSITTVLVPAVVSRTW